MTAPQIFGLRVGLGLLVGGWFIIWTAMQQNPPQVRRWLDIYLLTILSGIIGARIFYALLYWGDFSLSRLPRLWYGELAWQGTILGGGLALIGLCRWYKISLTVLGDGLALALPVILMALSWGCRGAGCGVGKGVASADDYPVWQVGYLRDLGGYAAPRYELQMAGVGLGLLILIVIAGLTLKNRLMGQRLWLALILIGAALIPLQNGQAQPDSFGIISAGILIIASVLIWSVKRGQTVVSASGRDKL